jgi:hypothetical protein
MIRGLCDWVSHCATSVHHDSYIITLVSSSASLGRWRALSAYYNWTYCTVYLRWYYIFRILLFAVYDAFALWICFSASKLCYPTIVLVGNALYERCLQSIATENYQLTRLVNRREECQSLKDQCGLKEVIKPSVIQGYSLVVPLV